MRTGLHLAPAMRGLLLMGALSAAVPSGNAQDSTEDPWAPLNLIDVECDQCRLRIDPALVEHQERIQRWADESMKELRLSISMAAAMAENADAIVDRVNEILGYEPDEEQRQEQRSMFDLLARKSVWPVAPADQFSMIVARRNTVVDYCESGGSLPNIEYDRETDQWKFVHWMTFDPSDEANGRSEYVLREMPIGINEIADLESSPFLELAKTNFGSVPVSMLVTATIYQMIDFADFHGRWFSSGFANAISMVVLRELKLDVAADELAAYLDVAHYVDIPKADLILRYWPNAAFEVKTSRVGDLILKSEQDLRDARHAWSYHECRRIIDEHGIEIVAKIMLAAGEQEQLKSQYLVGIVSQVTGDDISSRMNEYQDFGSAWSGYEKFNKRAGEARAAGDLEEAFVAMSRAIEIVLHFQDPKEFMKSTAWLLCEMGRFEDSAGYVTYLASQAENKSPEIVAYWHSVNLVLMTHFGHPELAYESIDPVLSQDPDLPIALAVQAHRLLHVDGKPEDARLIAEGLLAAEPDKWSGEQLPMLESIIAENSDDDR